MHVNGDDASEYNKWFSTTEESTKPSTCCPEWQLVRRAAPGTWHQATDNLAGTDVYGDSATCGATDNCSFSIAFENLTFNEFKFESGTK